MSSLPPTVLNLIEQFNKLPGIGPKTSEKLAFFLLAQPPETLKAFAESILSAKDNLVLCQDCRNLTESSPCSICRDQARDHHTICVVADIQDFLAIEKTNNYKGVYHILHGTLNPLEGITPDKLNIDALVKKIKNNGIQEIILGFNPDVEGETTMLYLTRLFKDNKVKVTRLGRGLPTGSDIEYADEVTLINALQDRKEV